MAYIWYWLIWTMLIWIGIREMGNNAHVTKLLNRSPFNIL